MHNPGRRIALLGWGSLLWDERPDFDEYHEPWQLDGPELPLEFSRVSSSRKGALTLVVDNVNGALCRCAYALSKRGDPVDAIADLRSREATVMRHMGIYFRDGTREGEPEVPATIPPWANRLGIDVVIWTGLPSNFEEVVGSPFSVENAVRHLKELPAETMTGAAKYICLAPALVDTPLRRALQAEWWFVNQSTAETPGAPVQSE
ncbi:hypothetical protein [Phaeovulum sp.]|uniref:hypothetical protein n=1 Tax=Phaeovulum sp. TaxID=2934796 RepID=UPI00356491BB